MTPNITKLNSLHIGGFLPFSTIDFPNHLACVVFLQGCNFRCGYCHNVHLWSTHTNETPSYTTKSLLAWLAKRQGKLTGVVFSGGEACLQVDALLPVLKEIKQMGFAIKLDTNGSLPEALHRLLHSGYVDTVAMDVKAPLHRYATVSGCSVNTSDIHTSLQHLQAYAALDTTFTFETRTTLIPSVLDEGDLLAMVLLLQSSPVHMLQGFVPDHAAHPSLRQLSASSIEQLQRGQELLCQQGVACQLRPV